MKKTILLITLQGNFDTIGLKSLHYQLVNKGFDSTLLYVLNYSTTQTKSDVHLRIVDFIKDVSPIFIGISLMSTEFFHAAALTRFIKLRFPSICVVWGGIHPTIAPEECLKYADLVCIGEGEHSIIDLANALCKRESPYQVRNMSFQKNGNVIRNPLYPLITNLSELQYYEHLPKNSYVMLKGKLVKLNLNIFRKYSRYFGTVYNVISSRGCPFSCTYCCNDALSSVYGRKQVRFREILDGIEELENAISGHPYIEYINFQDDCFLFRTESDLRQFSEIYKRKINRPFIARSIPKMVTKSKLTQLKSAGLSWMNLGLQSGNDRVCREIYGRHSYRKDFLEAARLIKQYDIAPFCDIITDNPFESDKDMLETVSMLIEIPKPFYVHFFSLTLYPGTRLYEMAGDKCPLKKKEYLTKDYLSGNKNMINKLLRVAAFLPAFYTVYLLRFYKCNANSYKLKMLLHLSRLLALMIFEPLTYFQLIRMSKNKDIMQTFFVLRYFLKDGLSRLKRQYR